MLKVLGVTFDHTVNYGSCLQAYALQTAIEKIRVGGVECKYEILPLFTMIANERQKTIKDYIRLVYSSKFRAFEKRFLHYADCSRLDELKKLNNRADAFVCGSDVES